MLAVIELCSMASWQASRCPSPSPGFEAASPATAVVPWAGTPFAASLYERSSEGWTPSGPSVSAHEPPPDSLSFDY